MFWVLIIIIISNGGSVVKISDHYFSTQQSCEQARVQIKKDLGILCDSATCIPNAIMPNRAENRIKDMESNK